MQARITILGGGSWGTALAEVQSRAGHAVVLWDRNETRSRQVQRTRINAAYYPNLELHSGIRIELSLIKALSDADVILLAVPSHTVRDLLSKIKSSLPPETFLVCAAKGLEADTLDTLSIVASEVLGQTWVQNHYCVLSGPSFAREVIRKIPTALTVAANDIGTARSVQEICHTDTFQLFASDDVIGVELAGALKNVVAIAAGASDGLGFGLNARAALITRALAEITRIGVKKGAHPLTFSGLSGLGDLLLTCTGDLSRNRQVGLKLAQGKPLKTILREIGQVAEGIRTAKAAHRLAQEMKVAAPILEEIYLTLYDRKPLRQAVADLLARAPEEERG
ncbi:MAG TPA: NAD(P)H-dependent glycerol-3-phosphate dehydrogenase [Bdellovibrionota bacterium]|nr:NAD(P)H-dependent glycerol-3-phosphate dehydrogenase [Bdellovibrionota bacterium]